MRKIKVKFLLVWLLVFSWLLSGWPRIQEVHAAVTYVASSAHVANGTTATLTISKPTGTAENDIMVAVINQKANQIISAPGGWASIGTINNGTLNQAAAFWKRAGASEGASYNFTKPTDDNLLWHGAISSFRGIITTGSPIDTGTGAPTTRATTPANNTITATGIDPTEADVMVIFAAFRGDDFTTMPVSGGTNPTFSQAYAYETTTGTDGSISLNYGISDGAATGDRTVVCTGTAALNEGIMFGLLVAPAAPGITGSLGKTTDGWAGAVPVYGTLTGGLTQGDYPYARAQVTTIASQVFYTDMTWDAGDSRFEGTIYPGSNYCSGCDDPKTYNGSFSVTVQLDNNPGFPSVDYSASAGTFTTAITLKRSSMDNAQDTNYTDFNAIWSTDHWNISISDFAFSMNTGTGTNIAVAVPIHPITSSPSNFTVAYNGSSVSGGSAESTTNAWWYNSNSHTLYLQFASLTTTLVDVDITFDNNTDLFATRYNWVYTYDMGSRKFSNGLYIANQYLTTFVYGRPFSVADNNVACSGNECEGAGMQAESRAHHTTGGADESTDCMERIAVHVDGTPRSDGTTYYQYDVKWKQTEWANYITSESNSQMVIVNNSDDTASTGWAQQLNNGIAAKRTQTYYSGKRYIKNIYEFTNNSASTHNYPMVWEREQWHGIDRQANDHGRFYGQSSDVVMEQRTSMSGFTCPWQTSYDSGTYINMGLVYDQNNLPDYGIFAVEPFLAPTTAEWPISITNPHATQTTNQTGFEKAFNSVGPGSTATFTFWHVHNAESSWANIESAMNADCAELNQVAPVVSVSISDGIVSYGIVPKGTAKSTLPGELNDMQTATNDGNVTETFNIKGQNAACPWTLAATVGTDQYLHQFCNDTDLDCSSPPTGYTALTTSYQTLDTGIAQSATVDFQLRVTVPTETSCYNQQSVDVTIQAVQP